MVRCGPCQIFIGKEEEEEETSETSRAFYSARLLLCALGCWLGTVNTTPERVWGGGETHHRLYDV